MRRANAYTICTVICLVLIFIGSSVVSVAGKMAEATMESSSIEVPDGKTTSSLTLILQFNPPVIDNRDGGSIIQIEDTHLWASEEGAPLIPGKSINVLLPSEALEILEIEITPCIKEYIGIHALALKAEDMPISEQNSESAPSQTSSLFLTEPLYPQQLYSTDFKIQGFRGFKILPVTVFPIRYQPATHKVWFFNEVRVDISIVVSSPASDGINHLFRGKSMDFEEVESIVVNPRDTEYYSNQPKALGPDEGPLQNYDLVIITNSSLTSEFQDLEDWKNRIGISTTIETVQDIEIGYNGTDTQEKIRNFTIYAYNNWNTEYVLLGGDVDLIPHRGLYGSTGTHIDDDIPSDIYYGTLDGNWNTDGDDYWGEYLEEDLFAEVYIGRAPVSNQTEAAIFVNKTIDYENSTIEDTYLSEVLFLGMKVDNVPTWGGDYKDEIEPYIPIPDYNITKLYERDGPYSASAVIDDINAGVHIVNNAAHGDNDHESKLTRANLGLFTNNKYFWWYTQSCYSAAYDNRRSGGSYENEDCIAEKMITLPATGAVAFIGNSRYGFYNSGETDGPSQYFDMEFFNVLFNENIDNLGKTLQKSKENLAGMVDASGAMRWVYFDLNLLGDPTLKVGGYPKGIEMDTPEEDDLVKDTKIVSGISLGAPTEVKVKVDSGLWETATGITDWTYDWDTTTYSDGNHTIYARAYYDLEYREVSVNVTVDNTPPNNPNAYSSSHTVDQWSDDNTVYMEWHGASDATSGVFGYSVMWSASPGLPVDTVNTTVNLTTSNPLADAIWHVSIRTVDYAGNWNSTYYSVGPFKIDITPPSWSDPSPIEGMVYDTYVANLRLEIDCTDPTNGISDTAFRYRFNSYPWSSWQSQNGSSGDTYWFDIPRSIWTNYLGCTLYWEVDVTDVSSLITHSPTFNGPDLIDDDDSGPSITNPWSTGDIYDSYAGDYRIQGTITDKSGINTVYFRYKYGSSPWHSWKLSSGSSGSEYWYDIPRTEWSSYIGESIYWEVRARDDDNDWNGDSYITYSPTFSNNISDDDALNPSGSDPTQGVDIYDSDMGDYTIQIDWTDDSGIKYVWFRYKFGSGSFTSWRDYSESYGSTYYFKIPMSEWLLHVGETLYFESYAGDSDDDRLGDGLSAYSSTYLAGIVSDDDVDAPAVTDQIESYNNEYRIGVVAGDLSGWTLDIEYNYSGDPSTIYTLAVSTFQTYTLELTITVPQSQMCEHVGETIFWRYQCSDMDNDRTDDGLSTGWSSWITGAVIIDKYPPITEYSLSGTQGNFGWYISDIDVTLFAQDGVDSGIKSTHYRVDGSSWETYTALFTITDEGIHMIEYYSRDISGNVEDTSSFSIKIDTSVPETTIDLTGISSIENVYCSAVWMELGATGKGSGIWTIEYRFNDGAWLDYIGSVQFSIDGEYSLEFRSTDNAGNVEEINSIFFTIDTISPEVTSTTPLGGESDVPIKDTISMDFSEPVDTGSIENNLRMYPEIEVEEYTWSENNETLTVKMSEDFEPGTTYYVMVGQDAKDASGNSLESSISFSFSTGEKEAGPDQGDLMNWLLIILLLVIVFILVIMLISGGRKHEEAGSDYATTPESSENEMPGEFSEQPPESMLETEMKAELAKGKGE